MSQKCPRTSSLSHDKEEMKAQRLSHLPECTWRACEWWSRGWSPGFWISADCPISGLGGERQATAYSAGDPDISQLCTTSLPAAISSLNDFSPLLLPTWSLLHRQPSPQARSGRFPSLSPLESTLCCFAKPLIPSQALSGRKAGEGRVP